MKIYVTNFYHIRFFPTSLLPVSINAGEPSWYHDNKGRSYIFRDKRGVINGVVFEKISSGMLDPKCGEYCDSCSHHVPSCSFITEHLNYLETLDFDEIYFELSMLTELTHTKDICFVVFEKNWRECGEAVAIIKWFEEHNIKIEDFSL